MALTDLESILGAELAGAIAKKGYATLTPVQEAVLDPALDGRDLRISSQTGSGKTVAIGLILRQAVAGDVSPSAKGGAARPRALVVAPTRELAKQVESELSWLFAPLRVKICSVTGGGDYREERRALGSGTAIIVGTPGRLLDHLNRGAIDASQLGAVVLDEADRMLDLGFKDDLEAILGFAPPGHRTHLVSATFPREVMTLANRVQTDPARIEGTVHGAANTDIEHLVHVVLPHERLDAIVNLMLETPDATTLIFARTRADVGELTHLLAEAGFTVDSLSGEMEQRERNKALAAFKRGDLDALVATDVAARGIDVQDVARVLHAEPPGDADAYTHRSGRTGRAGRKGKSSVLVTPPALNRVSGLLKRAGVRWRFDPIPSGTEIARAREDRLFEELTATPVDDPTTASPPNGSHEPDDRSWALAKRIAEAGEATRSLARLIARTRSGGPEPRAITVITPPQKTKRPWEDRVAERPALASPSQPRTEPPARSFGEARPDQPRAFGQPRPSAAPGDRPFGQPRGLRPDRSTPADRARNDDTRREPPIRTPRDAATDAGQWVEFRVSWGQIHGADARRLLAMVCRRGGIRGSEVGSIRVARTFSTVAVAGAIAASFEKAAREPDPRDPRVVIQPANEAAQPASAPAAPSRPAPARPAPASRPEAVETDRPSKRAPADRPSKGSRPAEVPTDRPSKAARSTETPRASKAEPAGTEASGANRGATGDTRRSAHGDRASRPRPSQPERYTRRPSPKPGPHSGHGGPRPAPQGAARPDPRGGESHPKARPRPPGRPDGPPPRAQQGSPHPSRHGDARPKRKKRP